MPHPGLPHIPKLCVRRDGRLYCTDPHLKKPVYFKSADEYESWRRSFLERIRTVGQVAAPPPVGKHVLVAKLCEAYLDFAVVYYRKNGKTTSEVDIIRMMIRHLVGLLGDKQADAVRPRDADALLAAMIDACLARRTINKMLAKFKTMMRWAVRHEIVSGETLGRLLAVPGLKKGRSGAREKPPVKPVLLDDVTATLSALRPAVQVMVQVQLHAAMRPQDVVRMCSTEIDRSVCPWEYVPGTHKTEHRHEDEDRCRRIFLGPQARELLKPYLGACTEPHKPLFRTRSGRAWTVGGYRCIIYWACQKAGVKRWSPNQLRHTMATTVRQRYGAEAARVYLGHESLKVTEMYAEKNHARSREIAESVG